MDTRDLDDEPPRRSAWSTALRWLASIAGVVLLIGGAAVMILQAVPDRRPVVLGLYCASSQIWVTTLAPLIEPAEGADEARPRGRVTSQRIKGAYERRCQASG